MPNFLGIPYPIRKNPKGFFFSQGDIAQIKSDLLILLLTNPGERIMEPTFGTPLRRLLFEPNDAMIQNQVKKMIIDSIKRWEPRIAIQKIEVTQLDKASANTADDFSEDPNVILVRIIFFDPENIKEVQELTLEVPLEAGSQ